MENNVLDLEKEKKQKIEQQKKLFEEYKRNLNKTFSTPEGLYALKNMAIGSGFFNLGVELENQNALFYQLGKKKMFIDLFSLLNNDIKKKLIDELYKE